MLVNTSSFVRALAVALVAAGAAVPVLAQNQAQPTQAPRETKLKDYEKKEIQSTEALLDAGMSGNVPVGASLYTLDPTKKGDGIARTGEATGVTWHHDMFRSTGEKVFVPFMLLFDARAMGFSNVVLGVRAVPKGSTTVAALKDASTAYPWNSDYFTQVRPADELMPNMQKVARPIMVPPGDYDVYVAVRPHSLEKVKDAPVKALLYKQTLTVPNFATTTELTTSSVMLLDAVKEVQPLPPAEAGEEPWVMGTLQFVPSLDRQFSKSQTITVFFQIYGEMLDAGRPDVTIEYSFFRKQGTEEKYFNKTAPQNFNAKTLPPAWTDQNGLNGSLGEVPLTSFEAGDYRLEVKITDNLAKKSITRDIPFSVTGA